MSPPYDSTPQAHLDTLIDEIHRRRAEAKLPHARNPEYFKAALHKLALRYKHHKATARITEEQRQKFKQIAKFARRLHRELSNLEPRLRHELIEEYIEQIPNANGTDLTSHTPPEDTSALFDTNTPDSPQNTPDERKILEISQGEAVNIAEWHLRERGLFIAQYEPYEHNPIAPCGIMQLRQELYWLTQGAELLSAPRSNGRTPDIHESWAAQEFVVICHRHGWRPLTLSTSHSEGKSGVKISDIAQCLSAVLSYAIDKDIAQTKAHNALRRCRHRFEHWTAYEEDDEGGGIEPTRYCGNLADTIDAEWEALIQSLHKRQPPQ